MSKKRISIQLDDNNAQFLSKIKREIMIENCQSIPFYRIIELGLVELRKNNNDYEIKEKLVHFDRLGQVGREGIITNL